MSIRCRLCARVVGVGVALLFVFLAFAAHESSAQLSAPPRIDLTDAIRVDEPAPLVRTQLQRVRSNIAGQQWDEAIEGLRQLIENHGERLVPLDSRFISLRELAHMELARLPAEGLALYRGRVDPQAEQWYTDGVKDRDAALLARVVDEFFASTFGDDALLALGEIALERGEHSRARELWERISPQLRSADGMPGRLHTGHDVGHDVRDDDRLLPGRLGAHIVPSRLRGQSGSVTAGLGTRPSKSSQMRRSSRQSNPRQGMGRAS